MRRYSKVIIPFLFVLLAMVGAVRSSSMMMRYEWFRELCGTERWSVKTGTDTDVSKINLTTPTGTTIAIMRSWPAQSSPPANNRIIPYETTLWVVTATLVEFKKESDEDYHLVLKDSAGNTIIAEIPATHCVGSGSPLLSGVTNARNQFDAKFNASSLVSNREYSRSDHGRGNVRLRARADRRGSQSNRTAPGHEHPLQSRNRQSAPDADKSGGDSRQRASGPDMECQQRRDILQCVSLHKFGQRDQPCHGHLRHVLHKYGPDERHDLLLQSSSRQCQRHKRPVQ